MKELRRGRPIWEQLSDSKRETSAIVLGAISESLQMKRLGDVYVAQCNTRGYVISKTIYALAIFTYALISYTLITDKQNYHKKITDERLTPHLHFIYITCLPSTTRNLLSQITS